MKAYLIVGQGIAGSVLAWHLMKKGHSVCIVDQNHHESSSIISAGIINPITGQRLALTPQFDLYYTQAIKIYSQISTELGENFFIPKPIIRILRSNEEVDRAHHLKTTSTANPYISGIHKPGHYGMSIHDPFGTLTITQGGYLQTASLLRALKNYFSNKNSLITEVLIYGDLKINDDGVRWKAHSFDAVIFCEGYKAHHNPWFKDLPYNFAKGEILKISFESSELPDAILCQQQWCLPNLDGTYLAGSTYDRANINTMTTTDGLNTILQGLNDFIPAKAQVIETYAGVRPVMLDQRPIAHLHPLIPRLGIFNGFGSKGILWAPYYAERFAEQIK